jgi:hypothetical protein
VATANLRNNSSDLQAELTVENGAFGAPLSRIFAIFNLGAHKQSVRFRPQFKPIGSGVFESDAILRCPVTGDTTGLEVSVRSGNPPSATATTRPTPPISSTSPDVPQNSAPPAPLPRHWPWHSHLRRRQTPITSCYPPQTAQTP